MGMSVQTNMTAMFASRNVGSVTGKIAKSTEKLTSGFKINRAADNAAGLAISEKLRRQVRGLTQATANAQEGVSLCQVADGALAEVSSMLHRMTELSIQSANETNTDTDRSFIQAEVQALKDEISRVGNTTTYNERPIFGDIHGEPMRADKLVSSPAAASGHLTESYQTRDGRYHAAATLDFSKVNENNIGLLNGKSFTFTCSQSCDEAFKITFDYTIPYSDSSAENLLNRVEHRYVLGIKDLKSGSDIVNKLYEHVSHNMPNGYTPGTNGELHVSHSNVLSIMGGNKLAIYAETNYATKAEAERQFAGGAGKYGAVNSSALTGISIVEDNRDLWIHTGTENDTGLYVTIPRMNADVIGVGDVNVGTATGAKDAIDKIKDALAVISKARSDIGAQQNRLEHTINSNGATVENTAAAESRIRDTDMAREMVNFSLNNILQQVGQTVMTQANQSQEGILALLR